MTIEEVCIGYSTAFILSTSMTKSSMQDLTSSAQIHLTEFTLCAFTCTSNSLLRASLVHWC